jgi:hypothetical protein
MKDVLKSGKDRYWIRTPGLGDYRKLEITQRIHDGADCYPWRPVFALWPVKTIGGRYVWLRKVYKQKFWVVWGKGFHMEPHVEYAELFDILTYEH